MGNVLGLSSPDGTCDKVKEETVGGVVLAAYTLKLAHEQRTFVVAVPEHLTADHRCTCVFFAHGVGGTAWYGAKEDTGWIKVARDKALIVVFLQSRGIFFEEQRKNSAGKMVWAASSWDCHSSGGDLAYLQTVHDAVISQLFPGIIDLGRVFFCGYDSGGMLAWPVACAFGGTLFSAICSYNGGVEDAALTDRKSNPMVSRATSLSIPVPAWLIVGETSEHRARSENGFRAFSELNWPCRYDVVKGGSEWPKDNIEEEILVWFMSARDEALAIHLSPKKDEK